MSYITWNDDFSVKIAIIDDQHKKLINMINDFYKSFNDKKSADSLVILVSGLKDNTEFHFLPPYLCGTVLSGFAVNISCNLTEAELLQINKNQRDNIKNHLLLFE